MAGGFNGMPLGSFSGRGADFQPMQFFLEQRRLAAQAEAQRKQQAAAQQQSFVMALMAKKQQEAELAQQAQQFQASQQARAAEKQMAQEQFRAEQNRLREAEQAQLELRKLGEQRAATERQRAQEEQRGLVAKAENRRALGLNVHAATVRGLEQRFQQFSAIPGSDPIQALDAIEAQALDETKQIDDPEAQALAVEEIRAWRADKESQLRNRGSDADARDQRGLRNKAAAEEADRKARADKNRTKIAAGRAELAGIKDDLDRLADDLSEARYLKDAGRIKEIEDEMSKLRKRRDEINRDLAELE